MLTIVSIFAFIASACAAGLDQHLIPSGLGYGGYGSVVSGGYGVPSVLSSGVYGPSVLSSGVVGRSVLSGVYGPSVLSSGLVGRSVLSGAYGPSVLSARVAVARPAAVAVERVGYGSIPSVEVVNEPTTIVQPGRPIRGHTFSSEVRHDSRAVVGVSAPVVASPYASHVVSGQVVGAVPSVASYSVGAPSYVASSPRLLATGPASIVAAPASVSGYSLETGRTDLVSQVRLRAASIPAQIVQDTVVESAPLVARSPYYSSVVGGPVVSSGLVGSSVVSGPAVYSDLVGQTVVNGVNEFGGQTALSGWKK